ncbi:hypothetical protein GCM10009629_58030 [Pseudonocardia alni]
MTAPECDTTHDAIPARIGSERAVVIAPTIREAYPAEVREGLARRRVVQTGGTCPCGARMVLPNRAARRRAARLGEPGRAVAHHTADCPATDENLAAARVGRR